MLAVKANRSMGTDAHCLQQEESRPKHLPVVHSRYVVQVAASFWCQLAVAKR